MSELSNKSISNEFDTEAPIQSQSQSKANSNSNGVIYDQDYSGIKITPHILNGSNNYSKWAQSVQMFMCAKDKMEYLTGEIPEPSTNDPTYKKWRAENAMVMAWLINSMDEDTSSNYVYYTRAKDIWTNCKSMFSDLEDTAQVLETSEKIKNLKQGDVSVTKYFANLKKLWQEIDLFDTIEPFCAHCDLKYKKKVQKQRIYAFLYGLTNEFDEAKWRIISKNPFPNPDEAFAEIR